MRVHLMSFPPWILLAPIYTKALIPDLLAVCLKKFLIMYLCLLINNLSCYLLLQEKINTDFLNRQYRDTHALGLGRRSHTFHKMQPSSYLLSLLADLLFPGGALVLAE